MQIQWKIFWSLFGPALSLIAVAIPVFGGVVWWFAAIVLGLIGTVILLVAGRVVHDAEMFERLLYSQRELITIRVRLAITALTLWTIASVSLLPEKWPWLALALPIIGICTYWGARGTEYRISRQKPEKPKPLSLTPAQQLAQTPTVSKFRPVLDTAGYDQVQIIGHFVVEAEDGARAANQFLIQTPATGK